MAYRRVLRSEKQDTATEKPSVAPYSPGKILWRWIVYFLCFIWRCIKTLWYWFERLFLLSFLFLMTVGLAWWLSHDPSNNRDWLPAESILPEVSMSGDIINITNVRNHRWITDKEFVPGYYNRSYNISEIESVHYLIVPFSDFDGPAHTMLSFTFSGGQHVVISGEVRKERGEDFDALKGVMNQFELMYVIADEEDVIKLRTNYRKNQVYMYPIKTEKEKIALLFRSMVLRADKIGKEPEFYNTLWNNCTTSILMHANALRTEKISWSLDALLPAHSDRLVYDLDLIDTGLSLEEAREYYRIDLLAQTQSGLEDSFSRAIRKEIK